MSWSYGEEWFCVGILSQDYLAATVFQEQRVQGKLNTVSNTEEYTQIAKQVTELKS